jgi:hypothetical protein
LVAGGVLSAGSGLGHLVAIDHHVVAVSKTSFRLQKMAVPSDRIELSTPGVPVARTDVRRRPQRSTIVFTQAVKSGLASTVYR